MPELSALEKRHKRVAEHLGWSVVKKGSEIELRKPGGGYGTTRTAVMYHKNPDLMYQHLPSWGYDVQETRSLLVGILQNADATTQRKFIEAMEDVLGIEDRSIYPSNAVRMILATPEQLFRAVEMTLFPEGGE